MKSIEMLDFLLELAEVLGFGRIDVKKFDKDNDEYEICITNSSTNAITCHHTRGYLASSFSKSLEKNLECKEVTCRSKGAAECKFVLTIE